jgi:hypothetical protein
MASLIFRQGGAQLAQVRRDEGVQAGIESLLAQGDPPLPTRLEALALEPERSVPRGQEVKYGSCCVGTWL